MIYLAFALNTVVSFMFGFMLAAILAAGRDDDE